jgi:hypothetical protein
MKSECKTSAGAMHKPKVTDTTNRPNYDHHELTREQNKGQGAIFNQQRYYQNMVPFKFTERIESV